MSLIRLSKSIKPLGAPSTSSRLGSHTARPSCASTNAELTNTVTPCPCTPLRDAGPAPRAIPRRPCSRAPTPSTATLTRQHRRAVDSDPIRKFLQGLAPTATAMACMPCPSPRTGSRAGSCAATRLPPTFMPASLILPSGERQRCTSHPRDVILLRTSRIWGLWSVSAFFSAPTAPLMLIISRFYAAQINTNLGGTWPEGTWATSNAYAGQPESCQSMTGYNTAADCEYLGSCAPEWRLIDGTKTSWQRDRTSGMVSAHFVSRFRRGKLTFDRTHSVLEIRFHRYLQAVIISSSRRCIAFEHRPSPSHPSLPPLRRWSPRLIVLDSCH